MRFLIELDQICIGSKGLTECNNYFANAGYASVKK